jgi:hypothetical protein
VVVEEVLFLVSIVVLLLHLFVAEVVAVVEDLSVPV